MELRKNNIVLLRSADFLYYIFGFRIIILCFVCVLKCDRNDLLSETSLQMDIMSNRIITTTTRRETIRLIE